MGNTIADKTDKNKQIFYDALVLSMGVVTDAVEATGLSRANYYTWLENDKEFKAKVDGIQDMNLDMAESALYKNIKEQRSSDVQFYLKTKGAKRGFATKVEVSGDLTVNWNEERTYSKDETG